jgi:ABC-2 type transport system ATP-binding protein
MSVTDNEKVLLGRNIQKSFRRDTGEIVQALDGVSLEVEHGTLTALVGPDGAGKTTLIRLAAGLMTADGGELKILGVDVAADPQQVQDRIGYMPQKFGLYEDLSVQENLDLYADLHGVTAEERRERYPQLMEMTALGPFTQRLAGRLSGGMKQKLGLACTLVRAPELLLLDEPTVGVDPLSRRELWEIIRQLVNDQGLTVLLSTSYLDEAERCGHVIVMHQGRVLAQGRPSDVRGLAAGRVFLAEPPTGWKAREFQARLLDHPGVIDAVPEGGRVRFVRAADTDSSAGSEISFDDVVATPVPARFEDGFMVLLQQTRSKKTDKETRRTDGETRTQGPKEIGKGVSLSPSLPVSQSVSPVSLSSERDAVVQVRDLVRQFGSFTAVDHISFDVQRGEIFGLLGPNGAGKTTTFRMLCGLLPATSGTLRVAGVDLHRARASARQRIGYVAQKFSLYGQLSVTENLEFFASAYNLRGTRKRDRLDWALRQFGLASLAGLPSGNLPGGFKQRLAMAAALLHEPEILFLDEPTSGADPLARREFWRRITALAEQGVTAVVTTHFMEEAEYCDRIAIMDAGRILAQGTPAEIRGRAPSQDDRERTMEDAFIAVVEEARESNSRTASKGAA